MQSPLCQFIVSAPKKASHPVWGFADVVASRCDAIEVGARFYGYYPMATHLLVEPTHIRDSGFIDSAAHRNGLAVVYNQYLRCSKDPLYQADTEALQMIFRPLFTTSFLLDDFLADKLTYSCMVGLSHWEENCALPADLPGPKPIMFFAPSQSQKRLNDWGGKHFQSLLTQQWNSFSKSASQWLEIETSKGPEAAKEVYEKILRGQANPKTGQQVSLL